MNIPIHIAFDGNDAVFTADEDIAVHIALDSKRTCFFMHDDIAADIAANADVALSQAYAKLIVGEFVTEAGEKYSFASDGTFTGFLNSENSEAVGTYTVQTDGTDNIVTILVNSESKKYSFKFTSDGYVVLTDLQKKEKKQLMDR